MFMTDHVERSKKRPKWSESCLPSKILAWGFILSTKRRFLCLQFVQWLKINELFFLPCYLGSCRLIPIRLKQSVAQGCVLICWPNSKTNLASLTTLYEYQILNGESLRYVRIRPCIVVLNQPFSSSEWCLERSDGWIGEQKNWPRPLCLENQCWKRGCGWLHNAFPWIWHRHHSG